MGNNTGKIIVPPQEEDYDEAARPLQNATLQHGFNNDYNPALYQNQDVLQVSKTRVTSPVKLLGSRLEWHLFHVPMLVSSMEENGSKYAPEMDETRRQWMQEWVAEEGGKDPDYSDDTEFIRERVRGLIQIDSMTFTTMLYDIRYRRDQMRHQREKIREKMALEEEEAEEKKQKKGKKKSGKISKVFNRCFKRPWRKCGFDSPSSATVLHYASCFHVGAMTMSALAQDYYEIQELSAVFGESTQVTSRLLSVIGLSLLLFGCFCGILGHYFRKRGLLYVYLILFTAGMLSYWAPNWSESYYAVGDGLDLYLKKQVDDYKVKKAKADTHFLEAAQQKFRCCGHKGFEDYRSPNLPPSCCEMGMKTSPQCGYTKGQQIPYYVHTKGCTSPVKTFLEHLFSSKVLVLPFMIFGTLITILTFLNLNSHRHLLYAPAQKSKEELDNFITFRKTLGELLLEAVVEATTRNHKNPGENILGTMENVRKRLGKCEKISDFIPEMLQIYHELGTEVEPDVIARAILGVRPKRFVSDTTLIGENFNNLLQTAESNAASGEELLRIDLKMRLDMQKMDEERKTAVKKKKKKYLEKNEKMNFPLPRPLKGTRVSTWKKVNDRFLRSDRFYVQEGMFLDHLSADYLEQDRVIQLLIPEEEVGCFTKCWAKLVPSSMEVEEAEYLFLEKGLYGPAVQILSNIIAELQGIIHDLKRKTHFRKDSLSSQDHSSQGSESNSPSSLDMHKVNSVLKKLCDLEVIREQRLNLWIQEQQLKQQYAASVRHFSM